jgi:hypothetical protein
VSFVNLVKNLPLFTAYCISGKIVFHIVSFSTFNVYNRPFLEMTEHITHTPSFLLGINTKFRFLSRAVHFDIIRISIYLLLNMIVTLGRLFNLQTWAYFAQLDNILPLWQLPAIIPKVCLAFSYVLCYHYTRWNS